MFHVSRLLQPPTAGAVYPLKEQENLFSSGIFGLWMYFAGALTIFGFKQILLVAESEIEGLKPGEAPAE